MKMICETVKNTGKCPYAWVWDTTNQCPRSIPHREKNGCCDRVRCMPDGTRCTERCVPCDPPQERACETCGLLGKNCLAPAPDCIAPDFTGWRPQPTPNCADCVHDFERKFEPLDIVIHISTEIRAQSVKAQTLYYPGFMADQIRDQLKTHGIE